MKNLFISLFLGCAALLTLETASAAEQKAVLAGGCFWCVEADMLKVKGVNNARSGYAGGERENPTYENYQRTDSTYKTPHIEVAEVTYDPAVLGYSELIATFLKTIDPTDGDGQFCDRGYGYKPAIFYGSDEEKKIAEEQIRLGEEKIGKKFQVALLPAKQFWLAEEYHQRYAERNPLRYNYYRNSCGRDQRIKEVWGQ